MAKVVITIEDRPDGKVKILCEPTFERMIAMEMSGETLSSAHGYAYKILNDIRKESKRLGPTLLHIPKLG